MNKQEAIELLRDVAKRACYRTGRRSVHIDEIVELVNQIDEPQKVVVPKFVAEWIEECKSDNKWLMYALCKPNFENHPKVSDWLRLNDGNILIFSRAWLDGYEIEKEKLYTVEIPDPNSIYKHRFLSRNGKGVCIDASNDIGWKQRRENQFTESEIKQDFEWAWQWAKEVE